MFASLNMLLAQGLDGANQVQVEAPNPLFIVIYLALLALTFAGMWKTCVKAGRQGWEGIVPIYNMFVMVQISGRPVWWFLLLLIPCVGIIFGIIVMIDLAAKFGKGPGFGIGLALLWFIFFPILGFGDAQYQGGGARY